ncbi:MAG TPA: YqaA family protein [Gammaproteobacteria bacterium]|nr:YqaA family protein [Gammaproteobacteria bacterium]
MSAYVSLFAAAFLAATVIPFYSEFAVAGMIGLGKNPHLTLLVATLGNTLGASVNWAAGRFLLRFEGRKWFPARPGSLERAQRWFGKYGVWSLLFAWLPVGGDALTFVAGIMRVNFALFFILTTIGKGGRYAVLIYILDAAVNGR